MAESGEKIVGAVWVRIMDDYGHVNDATPSLAISLLKEYRNHGIGTKLMKRILLELKNQGYKQTSLPVQKKNYAVRMYHKVGFILLRKMMKNTLWYVNCNLRFLHKML